MPWQKGTSGNPGGLAKLTTGKGKAGYTSRQPSEKCDACGVIIRDHLRCPCGCNILIGPGHYQDRACSDGFDLHPDAVFWVLAAMVESLKAELKSKREHDRAVRYVQSDDWAQWAGLIGVSANAAREALVGVA